MKLNFLNQFEFFAGAPDSLLKPLCDRLITEYGIGSPGATAIQIKNEFIKYLR